MTDGTTQGSEKNERLTPDKVTLVAQTLGYDPDSPIYMHITSNPKTGICGGMVLATVGPMNCMHRRKCRDLGWHTALARQEMWLMGFASGALLTLTTMVVTFVLKK